MAEKILKSLTFSGSEDIYKILVDYDEIKNKILNRGEGVDSITKVISDADEKPTAVPTAVGEGAIALGRHSTANGKNSVSLGYDTHAIGQMSFVANGANYASGKSSAAFGGSNHSNGDMSFTTGHANMVNTISAFACGNLNEVFENAINGFAANQENDVTGPNAAAFGYKNTASGDLSFVTGGENIAQGTRSMATGTHTKALGNFAFAGGSTTIAEGGASFAIGFNTKAKQSYAYAGGNGTETNGVSGFAHGSQLRVTKNAQAAFGTHNKPADNLLFMLGNGTSEADRKNAFAVDWSGNAQFAGRITAGANPVYSMDVATKQYVDSKPAILSGTTEPDASLGKDGDIYIMYAE